MESYIDYVKHSVLFRIYVITGIGLWFIGFLFQDLFGQLISIIGISIVMSQIWPIVIFNGKVISRIDEIAQNAYPGEKKLYFVVDQFIMNRRSFITPGSFEIYYRGDGKLFNEEFNLKGLDSFDDNKQVKQYLSTSLRLLINNFIQDRFVMFIFLFLMLFAVFVEGTVVFGIMTFIIVSYVHPVRIYVIDQLTRLLPIEYNHDIGNSVSLFNIAESVLLINSSHSED